MSKYLNPKLRELWNYDPETGKFTWKIETNGYGGLIHIGDEVGTLKDGYVQLNHQGRTYLGHVLAWTWQKGEVPPQGYDVDHKNRIRNDNRIDNLRLLTRGENHLNHSGPQSNSTTGFRGVFRSSHGNAWIARIYFKGVRTHLGTFQTIEEAVEARKVAEDKFWSKEPVDPIITMHTPEAHARRIEAAKSWHARKRSNPME